MRLPTGITLFRRIGHFLAMRQTKFASVWLFMQCAISMPVQVEAATLLQVEVANHVFYVQDGSDQNLWSTQAHPAQSGHLRTFTTFLGIGDIVAVNGTPSRYGESPDLSSLDRRPISFAGGPVTPEISILEPEGGNEYATWNSLGQRTGRWMHVNKQCCRGFCPDGFCLENRNRELRSLSLRGI